MKKLQYGSKYKNKKKSPLILNHENGFARSESIFPLCIQYAIYYSKISPIKHSFLVEYSRYKLFIEEGKA